MKRAIITLSAIALFAGASLTAHAAGLFLLTEFQLHAFDASILETFGYENGTVLYFQEMGSVTEDEARESEKYESFGCHPFYVLKEGDVVEQGYNCRTFFCAGFLRGPKQCRDRDGEPYGGIVEINKRYAMPVIEERQLFFADVPDDERTDEMNERVRELEAYLCKPFYVMLFDAAVGDGYQCEEVGQYPYFSNDNVCVRDWRLGGGYNCENPWRANEFNLRAEAIKLRGGSWWGGLVGGFKLTSTGSAASSVSSRKSSSSASSFARAATGATITFPDVPEGKYGYTAITRLAQLGVLSGYPDGTFKPQDTVNRAEFLKLLLLGLHPQRMTEEDRCFPDVNGDWFGAFVCTAKRLAWVKGYDDGLFRPERTMTKAEGLKVILSSLGESAATGATLPLGVKDGEWYTPYVRQAVRANVLLEPQFDPDAPATRADAAVWMYRAMKHMIALAR